jgi:hypothetical protein
VSGVPDFSDVRDALARQIETSAGGRAAERLREAGWLRRTTAP